jgi:hypothetical protein
MVNPLALDILRAGGFFFIPGVKQNVPGHP